MERAIMTEPSVATMLEQLVEMKEYMSQWETIMLGEIQALHRNKHDLTLRQGDFLEQLYNKYLPY